MDYKVKVHLKTGKIIELNYSGNNIQEYYQKVLECQTYTINFFEKVFIILVSEIEYIECTKEWNHEH